MSSRKSSKSVTPPAAKRPAAKGLAPSRSKAAADGSSKPGAAQRLRVSYQGERGANSHQACLNAFGFDAAEPLPHATFEDALAAVVSGDVRYAMIPIENSVAGRVADIHHLLPKADLFIVGEHFERVRHQLMAQPGARLEDIKRVLSHTQALGQCRDVLKRFGLQPVPEADTAGSARIVAESKEPSLAAIAPKLAAEIYGLKILLRDIEDVAHNTTRFVVLARKRDDVPELVAPETGEGPEPDASVPDASVITTFVFRVRNLPGALYKALGGFATNGVNMTKLESYQLEGTFNATMFYADIEGHMDEPNVVHAFDELKFFCAEIRILGSYPRSAYRDQLAKESALARLGRSGG